MYLKVGYVVMKHGDPVKTGSGIVQTAKLYQHPGRARVVAKQEDGAIFEAFIKVPRDA